MIDLRCGDCLELMKDIPDGSVDMVLCDPPYGTTACKWDSVIPFEPMWEQLNRIIKPNGAICLFGSEPFSSALRMSNIKHFKYDWIWEKTLASNFSLCKKQPNKKHEIVSVFYKSQPTYNPQMETENLTRTRNAKELLVYTVEKKPPKSRLKIMVQGILRAFKNLAMETMEMYIQRKSPFHCLNILSEHTQTRVKSSLISQWEAAQLGLLV